MTNMTAETVIANVLTYVAAWNEADVATRLELLGRCWAEDGAYIDPTVALSGRAELAEHISRVRARRVGARIELMSGVDLHHNVVRFLWRLVRADGSQGDVSIDFGEVDTEGRLTKIVGFFGDPPSVTR
jgi:hypothetical protein